MTDILQSHGHFDKLQHRAANEQELLPTPQSTPLPGSPLLRGHASAGGDVFGSLEGRLYASTENDDLLASDSARSNVSTSKRKEFAGSSLQRDHAALGKSRVTGKVGSPVSSSSEKKENTLRLSPQGLKDLALEPSSLPIRQATPSGTPDEMPLSAPPYPVQVHGRAFENLDTWSRQAEDETQHRGRSKQQKSHNFSPTLDQANWGVDTRGNKTDMTSSTIPDRPGLSTRTLSTPPMIRRKGFSRTQSSTAEVLPRKRSEKTLPAPLDTKDLSRDPKPDKSNGSLKPMAGLLPSPMPTPSLPLPPLSMPTFLQLELDSHDPSPLYIHRSSSVDFPYESSAVKFERLENFLLLPSNLEGVLMFGAAACFDAWLYTMTILPLRFLKAMTILTQWWLQNAWKEICDLVEFVYRGVGRLWRRTRSGNARKASAGTITRPRAASNANEGLSRKGSRSEVNGLLQAWPERPSKVRQTSYRKHRRVRSTPSLLLPSHKADLLKGFLIVSSSYLLMQLDPSRMYHNIRGQAAIKLYVIYNMLEVADKLLGSIGQDILECLFSKETLERKPDGRSKILRPLGLFLLALIYNVIHAAALFYQVITLNVAVNSYSNALLTLLMSNQFVEIKGAVFKKFEKENLFQMCCADVVERFQLLLMLLIIAIRNIVEVGGLNISLSSPLPASTTTPPQMNATGTPFSSSAILPKSFAILPQFPMQVFAPFLIVVGSEMIVDWLKYAYINKFNNFKPNIFGRFYDVLAKDYYTNAFADQNLTRRIGLPVFPLTCLFIRASVQTYHMLIAMHLPPPIPSVITGISLDGQSPTHSPATTAALARIDKIFRRALGRSNFEGSESSFSWFNFDDSIAFATTVIVLLIIYLLLLAFKLVWGMFMLALARRRYKSMKLRENIVVDSEGKRVGGWGTVEVGEDRRRWIYEDDESGLSRVKERDKKNEQKLREKPMDYGKIRRYDMVAKRIW